MSHKLGLASEDVHASRSRLRNADVTVVVPMHNESRVIVGVLTDLQRCFRHVVCVDDGSTDGSEVLAADAGATVVRHSVNLGQGAALQTGIDFALMRPDARFIVTFDSDGQHRVEDALSLVEVARTGSYDLVLGSRFLRDATEVPAARRLLLKGATLFTRWMTGLQLTDAHNGLRAIRREAAAALNLRLPGMAHASELLAWASRCKLSVTEVPVRIQYTAYSRSKGQPGINALNVMYDLLVNRLLTAP